MATRKPLAGLDRALSEGMARAARLEVRVGILQKDGVKRRDDGEEITNAELAAVLEYGVPQEGASPAAGDSEGWRIPPRPAHGDAAREHGAEWQARMADAVSEVLDDAFEGRSRGLPRSLKTLAVQSRADVRRNIPYWSVPNAPSTIAKKGSSAPLIGETADLANSIRAVASDGRTSEVAG